MIGRPVMSNERSICLNMIVRNEAQVIRRCLASVKPLIDSWVIVDTGSDDDTMALVREELAGIDGELHQRPWRDFAHNRNEAIELAKGRADYLLVIDADEELQHGPDFELPALEADSYMTVHHQGGSTRFHRTQLLRAALAWRYEGVLHEVLMCADAVRREHLDGLECRGYFDGARNRDPKQKYLGDAAVLQRALESEPDSARYAFYLARSYRDAGQALKAIHAFRRRVVMRGWDEEVWSAQYEMARLLERQEGHTAEAIEAYLDAYQLRPTRAEPLYELSRHYRERASYQTAYLFAQRAARIQKPDDLLFLDHAIYDWRVHDELAVAAYGVGQYAECIKLCEALLAGDALPADRRERIEENRRLAQVKLAERSAD